MYKRIPNFQVAYLSMLVFLGASMTQKGRDPSQNSSKKGLFPNRQNLINMRQIRVLGVWIPWLWVDFRPRTMESSQRHRKNASTVANNATLLEISRTKTNSPWKRAKKSFLSFKLSFNLFKFLQTLLFKF